MKNLKNHDQRIVCGFDLIQLNQTQLLGYLSRKENRRDKVTRSMTKEDLCLYFKMSYFYLVLMHDIRFMTRAPSTHFHRDEHMTHVNYSKYLTNEMWIKLLFSRFSSSSYTINRLNNGRVKTSGFYFRSRKIQLMPRQILLLIYSTL